MHSVALIEKSQMILKGIRHELQRDPSLQISEYQDLGRAFADFEAAPPAVILLDLTSVKIGPFRHLMKMKSKFPDTRLVLVTAGRQFSVAQSALDIGVCGIVSKEGSAQEYLDAVHAALQRNLFISPHIMRSLPPKATGSPGPLRLTSREIDVLIGLVHGCSTRELAHIWDVKYGTILKDLEFLREKFYVRSMNELIRAASDNKFFSIAVILSA